MKKWCSLHKCKDFLKRVGILNSDGSYSESYYTKEKIENERTKNSG